MSFIGKAVGGILGGITGATAAAQGAQDAARTQAAASQAGIDEQRRQFDALVQIMSPYVQAGAGALEGMQPYAQAGVSALQQQQALAGTLGPEAQQQAIAMIEQSPQMISLVQQGENALLQGASATGGLRGGNIQGALAQFRPQVLSSLIDQQYGRLGGLTDLGVNTQGNIAQLGQSSAAGQAAGGLRSATSIGELLGQQGAATAGGQLARSGRDRAAFSDALSIAGAASGFFKGE
jgi:hypothetical protein